MSFRTAMKSTIRTTAASALIALAGCTHSEGSNSNQTKPSGPGQEPTAQSTPPGNTNQHNAAAAKNSGGTASPSHGGSANATPTHQPEVKTAAATPATETNELTLEDRRTMAQDLIYARIRVTMESLIDQRAHMLRSGAAASEPAIRDLEGKIMRARDLLMEAGEKVEDVEPPIVQNIPK